MAEKTVDFIALGRVSKRAELKSIRLAAVSAKCENAVPGPLEPSLEPDCSVVSREANTLRVACSYRFAARVGQVQVAEATMKYLMDYEIAGAEPLEEGDVSEFSFASGVLHSWPFVRELLYSLTARMGYPPYTLPVYHFVPKPRPKRKDEGKPKPASTEEGPDSTASPSS